MTEKIKAASGLPKLAGKKVLITGGLGFIGSNLARRCLDLGAKVDIYDCLNPRSGGNLYNIEDIRGSLEVGYHDIQDFDRLCEHVCGKDMVFNCAASTSHPQSMREPWLDIDVNSMAMINLLEAVRRFNKAARLVHLGTTTQLGKLQYQPADENHPEFPADIYSANKSVSEKYVLIYARAYGLDATVARLSNVYGPRACINSPEFTFNNYFVGQALQNRDITIFGTGAQKRNIVYVGDAVEALLLLAGGRGLAGETFFVAGDTHYSVAEIAEQTVKHIGSGRVRYVEWPAERKAVDFGDAVISNAKIKKAVGWAPRYDLPSGLAETKAYYAACLAEYLR